MSMPTLFVSHGSPMLYLEKDVPGRAFLASLGQQVPRPKAILAVSAHWNTEQPAVSLAAKPETIRPDSAGEHQGQPGGTIFNIMQRLSVGGGWIRKLDTLDDPPRRPCLATEHGARAAIASIERRNVNAVIGLRHQPFFKGRTFEHA